MSEHKQEIVDRESKIQELTGNINETQIVKDLYKQISEKDSEIGQLK